MGSLKHAKFKYNFGKGKSPPIQVYIHQKYGPFSYSKHVEATCKVAKSMSASDDILAAFWLHDVIENTDVTREEFYEKSDEKTLNYGKN